MLVPRLTLFLLFSFRFLLAPRCVAFHSVVVAYRLKAELRAVNKRLSERGVDLRTERKMEMWKQRVDGYATKYFYKDCPCQSLMKSKTPPHHHHHHHHHANGSPKKCFNPTILQCISLTHAIPTTPRSPPPPRNKTIPTPGTLTAWDGRYLLALGNERGSSLTRLR